MRIAARTWLAAIVGLGACGSPAGDLDAGRDATSSVDAHADVGAQVDGGGVDAAFGPDAAPGRRDGGPITGNPRLAAIAPGDMLDLGPVHCVDSRGTADEECRAATDYSAMVYDPNGHRVLLFGGGHSATSTDAIQVLDLRDSLTWSDLYAPTACADMTTANLDTALGAWTVGTSGPFPRPVSAHTYDLTGFAPELDELVVLGRLFTAGGCTESNDIVGPIAHYSMSGGTWAFSADPGSMELQSGIAASERDPISGRFIGLGHQFVVYDPATRTASPPSGMRTPAGDAAALDGLGYSQHLVYFPPNDRFYYFIRGTGEVYELTPNRTDWTAWTIEAIPTTGTFSPHDEPGYAFDPVHEIIGGGVVANTFYAFDPVTRVWTATPMNGGDAGDQAFHAIVYDPVDQVFVFRTGYQVDHPSYHTWAYRFPG